MVEDEDIFESDAENVVQTFTWSQHQQLQLIAAVEQTPVIWDVTHDAYKTANKKLCYWNSVAILVDGKPSVECCKKNGKPFVSSTCVC